MNLNSRENCGLNVNLFFHSTLPLALLPLLLKLLSATWAATICMHLYFDHLFVPLPSLCLSIRLPCTRFSKHLFAVHLVVMVCTGDIRFLFKLL